VSVCYRPGTSLEVSIAWPSFAETQRDVARSATSDFRVIEVEGWEARLERSTELSYIRVLLVEDEPLVAKDVADQLREAGAIIVGPCATARRAIDLLHTNEVDVAIIDFVLADNNSETLQRALDQRGIPFVVLTGYPRVLVRRNNGQQVLSKPVTPNFLLSTVKNLSRA
jgi:CheY-like chemotaxis protein